MMIDPDFTESLREIVFSLLAQPTAPFHEDAVAAEVVRLLSPCSHVTLEQDAFGNLLASYERGTKGGRWAFAAHMDHPAWVRNERGEWELLGGVKEEYLGFPRRVEGKLAEFGKFAVWDLPPVSEEAGRINAPACDDLIGCAVMVAMLCELERRKVEGSCMALFTRAEEVGFAGAMELAKSGIVPADWKVISLETSAERAPAVMGGGVIVRVGDRSSVFDPAITAELLATAGAAKVPHQRCLMSGGTCEGTAYSLAGYDSGALCVALGNYHNMGPEGRIEREYVEWSDVQAMAGLCVALVEAPVKPVSLLGRLEENREKYRRFDRPLLGLTGAAAIRPVPVRQAMRKG